MTEVESANSPLQNTQSAKRADFEARASDEKKRIYAEGIATVESSGIRRSAKQVGDTAVYFTLPVAYRRGDRTGATAGKCADRAYLHLGGWYPYCNLTLTRLQEQMPNFKAAAASLIALTPEVPDSSRSTKEKNDRAFEFPVLWGTASRVITAWSSPSPTKWRRAAKRVSDRTSSMVTYGANCPLPPPI